MGKNNKEQEYSINENGVAKILIETNSEKVLGQGYLLLLTLFWVLKIRQICYKEIKKFIWAYFIIGYITYKSPSLMIPLFKTLVRPVLNSGVYGNTIWYPREYEKEYILTKQNQYKDISPNASLGWETQSTLRDSRLCLIF